MYPVAIVGQSRNSYAQRAPFHPPRIFPETPFAMNVDETNEAYISVRELFLLLKYDEPNVGTAAWNPLGWLIKPGETIFLKPNMIAEKHYYKEDWEYVITHGSVIRSVIDYVFIALKGEGRIIIGDSPSTEAEFDEIVRRMGLKEIQSFFRKEKNFAIEIIDLRDEHWIEKDRVVLEVVKLPGDPRGKLSVDLAGHSMFVELDGQSKQYYGAFYDTKETNQHHRDGRHEYSVSKSPIVADVFISLPKLKTHKKCGLTVNLKGLVGISALKNWLPHYTFGAPATGGDQFERASAKGALENAVVRRTKQVLLRKNPVAQIVARKTKHLAYKVFGETEHVVRSGNWYGNNTVWRMALDLNRILLYADADGSMRATGNTKRYFSIVDGIVAMEGNGPVAGVPKATGVVLAGANPVAVDAVCARLMGFDYHKLAIIARAFESHRFPLIDAGIESIMPVSKNAAWNRSLVEWKLSDTFRFEPHFGWKGKVEAES
ncbi:MAG TPA: hypothetical protein DCK93_03190 [Blastocatellia bacterium]|jgi:uncharacterized protein (DUF362 family)|nr:hypothetical protein [Blastocatellia bacterium]